MYRFKFFGQEVVTLLILLPIALPGIVTGISLRSAFDLANIPFSYWTIVAGPRHVLHRRGLQQRDRAAPPFLAGA